MKLLSYLNNYFAKQNKLTINQQTDVINTLLSDEYFENWLVKSEKNSKEYFNKFSKTEVFSITFEGDDAFEKFNEFFKQNETYKIGIVMHNGINKICVNYTIKD